MSTVRRAWPKRLIRPRRCSSRDGFHGRSTLMSVPRGLQVESFARGIRSHNEANVALLDRLLDVLTLDGGTDVAPEDAALASAGVYGHRLIGEDLCQFGSNPLRRVVILAENDAAVLQP